MNEETRWSVGQPESINPTTTTPTILLITLVAILVLIPLTLFCLYRKRRQIHSIDQSNKAYFGKELKTRTPSREELGYVYVEPVKVDIVEGILEKQKLFLEVIKAEKKDSDVLVKKGWGRVDSL